MDDEGDNRVSDSRRPRRRIWGLLRDADTRCRGMARQYRDGRRPPHRDPPVYRRTNDASDAHTDGYVAVANTSFTLLSSFNLLSRAASSASLYQASGE